MKLIIGVLAMALITIIYACDFSGNDDRERELFEKIKVGMKREEVIKILGQPDHIQVDSLSNNDYYYYYFTQSKSAMRSELPQVLFDSTNTVKFSTYGEGG